MVTTEETIAEFQALMSDPAARQAFVDLKAQHAGQGAGRRYEHVLRVVGSRPWALEESILAIMVDVLAFRAYGGRLTAEEIEGRIGAARRVKSDQAPQGVARIPISGVLVPRASAFESMSGGTSTEEISGMLTQAVNSPQVGSIVLDIDSPGGMVDGIPELSAQILEARNFKPVVAVANTEALSAAYWLGSQAEKLFASPSARVGSIGVLSTHEDRSGQAEQKGVKTSIISAGKFKAEGNPFEPLDDEARAHLQEQVDHFYGMFVEAVAAGRGVEASAVRSGFGQGRFMNAAAGLKAGMIDGIATIDEVIQSEFSGLQKAQAARALADDPGSLIGGYSRALIEGAPELDAEGKPWRTFSVGAVTPTPPPAPTPAPAPAPTPQPEPAPAIAAEPETALDAAPDAPAASPPESPVTGDTDAATDIDPITAIEEAAGLIAAVDNTAWDGNRAMGQCNSAGDYRSICAGEHNAGTPDERQHWALPHHYLGRGPNASGVRAALSRLPQTQDLKNRGAAQSHLDAHMAEISPKEGAYKSPDEMQALEAELGVLRSFE